MPADELNNRALEQLAAGLTTDAAATFAMALEADPRHPAAAYNAGLLRWRSGLTTDAALVDELDAIRCEQPDRSEPGELLGRVHLERGDLPAARSRGVPPPDGVVDAALLGEAHCPWLPPLRSNRDLPDLALAYSADGRLLVSGHRDRVLRVWRDGVLERELIGAEGEIRAAAVHPDGHLVIAAGRDSRIRLWDLETGEPCGVLDGHDRDVMALAVSPDGHLLLSGGYDRTLRLWRLPAGEPVTALRQDDWVQCVALSAAGLALAGSFDGFRLWNVTTGDLLHHWPSTRPPGAAAFTPDGRYAISADSEAIHLRDVHSGQVVHSLRGHRRGVRSMVVAPDGRHLLSGGYDGTGRYWELAPIADGAEVAGRCLRTFPAGGQVAAAWISADGTTARTGAVTGIERRWQLPGLYRASLQPSPQHPAGVLAARANRFEDLLAAAGRPDADRPATLEAARAVPGYERNARVLAAWRTLGSLPRGSLRAAWTVRTLTGHTAPIVGVALDEHCAVTAGLDGTARVWSDSGDHVLHGHEGRVHAVAVHASTTVLTGGQDGTLRVWRLAEPHDPAAKDATPRSTADPARPDTSAHESGARESGARESGARESGARETGAECVGVLAGLGHAVWAVALSPDGRQALAGTARGRLVLVDVATARIVAELAGHTDGIKTVAFSPDGRQALSGGYDRTLRLWSMPSGEPVNVYRGHEGAITSAAFGSGFLVSAGHDRTLRRWGPTAAVLPSTLLTQGVNAVSVTGDGRFVIAAGTDTKLRLYSTVDGQPVATLPGHRGEVQAVATGAGDWYALSGDLDGVARVWYLDWELRSGRTEG
ncbi:hypothetical protein ACQP00_15420 [Dactylosporangium sp. CS-047395]|uniref:hypothetical protein n=1 Tax=Dactylosporangium sp. CS-047395 TaxID=3239936 RepID=UPI003D8CF576